MTPIASSRIAFVNTKLLIASILGFGILVCSALAAHQWQQNHRIRRAYVDAQAAYDRGDWINAAREYGKYIAGGSEDVRALHAFADAHLRIVPPAPTNIAAALSAYRRILRIDPRDELAYRNAVLLYRSTDNFGEAEFIARQHLHEFPADIQSILTISESLLVRKKPDQARETLEEFLDSRSADTPPGGLAQVHVFLSILHAEEAGANRFKKSLEHLDTAIGLDPRCSAALAQRAFVHRRLAHNSPDSERPGLIQHARADLKAAIDARPADPRVCLLLVDECMALGDYDRAAAALQHADALTAEDVRKFYIFSQDWELGRWVQRARLCLSAGPPESASEIAREAMKSFTQSRHRNRALPLAIELFARAGMIEPLREALREYSEWARPLGHVRAVTDQLAYLSALALQLENRPYLVIDTLMPVYDQQTSSPAIISLLTRAMRQTGQHSRADQVLISQQNFYFDRPDYLAELAHAYIRRRAFARAATIIDRLQSDGSNGLDMPLMKATLMVEQLKYLPSTDRPAALTELEQFTASLPDPDVGIVVLRSRALELCGKPDAALDALSTASGEDPAVLNAKAGLLCRLRRFDEAKQTAERLCSLQPGDGTARLLLAGILSEQGDAESALASLNTEVHPSRGRGEEAALQLAAASLRLQIDRAAGIRELRRFAADNPGHIAVRELLLAQPEICADRASAVQYVQEIKSVEGQQGLRWRYNAARVELAADKPPADPREIIESLRYCLRHDPCFTDAAVLLGRLHEQLGDFDQAQLVYQNSLQTSPSRPVADCLVRFLSGRRQFSQAREVITMHEYLYPPPDFAHRQAELAFSAGEIDECIEILRKRHESGAIQPEELILLAAAEYRRNRNAPASFRYLDQIKEDSRFAARIAETRAHILAQEGRLDKAAGVLDELISSAPTYDAHLLRGQFNLRHQRIELAREDFDRLPALAGGGEGEAALGEFHAGQNRPLEAIRVWREGSSKYPRNLRLKLLLAAGLLAQAHDVAVTEAHTIASQLLEEQPEDPEVMALFVQSAMKGRSSRDLLKSVECLRRAGTSGAMSPQSAILLVSSALSLGENALAASIARRASDRDPDHPGLRLLRARAELAIGYPEVALAHATSALQAAPGNLEGMALLLRIARLTSNPSVLETLSQTLNRADPQNKDSRAALLKAEIMSARGDEPAAIDFLENYLSINDSDDPLILVQLARLYQICGDDSAVEVLLPRILAAEPDNPAVIGLWLYQQARANRLQSVADYAAACATLPHAQERTLLAAGHLLARSPDHQTQAQFVFAHLCERITAAESAMLGLGQLAYQRGDVREAEACYRRVLDANPAQAEALNNLAWILLHERKSIQDALPYAQRAVAAAPANPDFRHTLGLILARIPERQAEANEHLLKALQLNPLPTPTRAKCLLEIARVCRQRTDAPDCRAPLNEALAIHRAIHTFSADELKEIDVFLSEHSSDLSGTPGTRSST